MDTQTNPDRVVSPAGILSAVTTLAGGEVLARAVSFVATTLLARRLGPAGFGVVGFATAVCSYFVLAVGSSIQDVGSREVARAPGEAVGLYLSVAAVRLLLACCAFALLAVLVGFLPKPPLTQWVVLLSGLSLFSLSLDPGWVFKGLERPTPAAAGLVLAQGLYVAGVALAVRAPGEVTRVPILQFAGELVAALVLGAVLWRGSHWRITLRPGFTVLRSSGYLGVGKILRTVVISADVVLLGFLTNDHAVGLYSAAYRFTFLLMAVVAAVAAAYLPSYARVMTAGPDPARRLVGASLGIAVTIGAPLVAGSIVVAGTLMTLVFGVEYADGALAFRVLALSVGLLFLHWSVSNVLIAGHRTGLLAAIHGAAAIVNIGLNLILIPRYGIVGSAWATVFAELTVVVAGIAVLHRMRMVPSLRPMLPPIGAAGGMSLVLWLIAAHVPIVVRVGVGAAVYVVLLAGFGGLPSAVTKRPVAREGQI